MHIVGVLIQLYKLAEVLSLKIQTAAAQTLTRSCIRCDWFFF